MASVDAYSSLTDQALLEHIAEQRDKNALAELYDRYRHSLTAFLRRKLYEDKLVGEVYNDVMFTVWQKAENFRGDSKVSTWIFGIAFRVCLTNARKEQKHRIDAAATELDSLPSNDSDDNTDTSDAADQLHIAISKLSERHREVIQMSYFEDLSLAEIAEIINCPLNTVKTRLFHARQKLKAVLEKE